MPHFGHSQTLVWFVSAVISFGAAAGAASVPEGVAVLASPAFCADFCAAGHPARARAASNAKRTRFIVHSGCGRYGLLQILAEHAQHRSPGLLVGVGIVCELAHAVARGIGVREAVPGARVADHPEV